MNVTSAHLSPADREELARVLAADITFIDHPDFHLPDAEQHIITDAPIIAAPDSSWLIARMNHESLASLGPVARLSADEERSLFMQFNYCRMRVAALVALARDGDEQAACELLNWHHRAIETRNQIVEHFLPFVIFLAGKGDNGRKFHIDGYEFEDIVSEGMRGLIRAVELTNMQGPFRPYAAVMIKGYFGHLIEKVKTYRRVYHADLEGDPDRAIAGQISAESMRKWKAEKQDVHHAHLVEQLRIVLDENRAGLTEIERAVLEARYRDAQGKKPLAGVGRIASIMHMCTVRVQSLLRTVMGKLRAALDRATVMTRVAQLVIARRLRGESEAGEANRSRKAKPADLANYQPRINRFRFGVWGARLLTLAQGVGIASYQRLAEAIGVSVVSAWRMLQHDAAPSLRLSTRAALCKALKIDETQLATLSA